MLKLAWATDVHLNFLNHPKAVEAFGEYISEETKADALLVTGDITEYQVLDEHLIQLAKGFGKPFYFILGNHDYYHGSVRLVHELAGKHPGWLTKRGVVTLAPNVALVGHEGWYDAMHGNSAARFIMTDWLVIGDFMGLDRGGIIKTARELSSLAATAARVSLLDALDKHDVVIFATHYPPFKGACWHEGGLSEAAWLPWFTSKMMGDMLLEVAESHPNKRILVFCGHTHSSGVYEPRDNLHVLTGEAVYSRPDLAGLIEIDGLKVTVSMKINKKPTVLSFGV